MAGYLQIKIERQTGRGIEKHDIGFYLPTIEKAHELYKLLQKAEGYRGDTLYIQRPQWVEPAVEGEDPLEQLVV